MLSVIAQGRAGIRARSDRTGRELGHMRERVVLVRTWLFSSRDRINPLRGADGSRLRYHSYLQRFNRRSSMWELARSILNRETGEEKYKNRLLRRYGIYLIFKTERLYRCDIFG